MIRNHQNKGVKFYRVHSEDYGVVGVRYGSENLSFGASFVPFPGMQSFMILM